MNDVVNVTFSPGSSSALVIVSILDDQLIEDREQFRIVLQNPSVGRLTQTTASSVAFITDNDGKYIVQCVIF